MVCQLASTAHVHKRAKFNAQLSLGGSGYLKAVVMNDDESVWMKDEFSCEISEMDVAEYNESSEDDVTAEESSSEGDQSSSVDLESSEVMPSLSDKIPMMTSVAGGSCSESDATHILRSESISSSTVSTPAGSVFSGPSTIPASPPSSTITLAEGTRVSVLRSSGTWTPGTIQRISSYYTTKLDDGSIKLIPLTHTDKYLKCLPDQPDTDQLPEYGWDAMVSQLEKVLRPRGSTGMKLLRPPIVRRVPKRQYIDIS